MCVNKIIPPERGKMQNDKRGAKRWLKQRNKARGVAKEGTSLALNRVRLKGGCSHVFVIPIAVVVQHVSRISGAFCIATIQFKHGGVRCCLNSIHF